MLASHHQTRDSGTIPTDQASGQMQLRSYAFSLIQTCHLHINMQTQLSLQSTLPPATTIQTRLDQSFSLQQSGKRGLCVLRTYSLQLLDSRQPLLAGNIKCPNLANRLWIKM
jgi:hypothetical protein